MAHVAFIGLGNMRGPMAANLVKTGVQLVVFDANPEATKALVDAGARAATSVAELVGQAVVVFTSLPGPAQVEEVVFGPHGILANMAPGLVLFELSTSSLSLNRRIYDAFKNKGGWMLDAPVSGGEPGPFHPAYAANCEWVANIYQLTRQRPWLT